MPGSRRMQVLRNVALAYVLMAQAPLYAAQCVAPEDQSLVDRAISTGLQHPFTMPTEEGIQAHSAVLGLALADNDEQSTYLSCSLLIRTLDRNGELDSRASLYADCPSGIVDTVRAGRTKRDDIVNDWLPVVRVAPVYPARALGDGRSGAVVFEFTVDKKGRVKRPKVVASSHKVFERAAMAAVKRFRYLPQNVNGELVEVDGVMSTISFIIDGEPTGICWEPFKEKTKHVPIDQQSPSS